MDKQSDYEKVDFDEFLNDCELERISQIGLEFQNSETYLKLSEQYKEVSNQLKAELPKHMWEVLRRYSDMIIEEVSEVEQIFYRQGLADAAKLIYGLLRGKL
jgi:hypothetical protein